jgi:hypothetical protein
MNSMSFGEYMNAGGFIQKTVPGPPSYTPNKQTDIRKRFDSRNLQKTYQDGVQKLPPEGGAHLSQTQVSRPHL